jgi:hypothetical protein
LKSSLFINQQSAINNQQFQIHAVTPARTCAFFGTMMIPLRM